MPRFLLLVVFSALAMLPGSRLFAQREIQDRAAVIIAVEGVDDLLGDVSYLVGAAGFPEFVPLVTFGAGEFVRGIDKSQPLGAYVTFDGEQPIIVGFVPVTDLEQVLDTLSNQNFEIEEDGDYRLLTGPNGQEVVVLEQDGWAFVSDAKENLENLPGDPGAIVSELADKYVVAAQANIRNIPKSLKDQAISALREGFEDAMDNVGDEDLGELQQKFNKMSMNNLVQMINGSETIMIGWAVDKEGKRTYIDTEMTAKDGSMMARRIAASGSVEPSLLGFAREGTAMKFHMAGGMLEEDRAQYVELIQEGRQEIIDELTKSDELNDSDKKVAAKIINQAMDIATATVKAGKLDMAGSVSLENDTVDFIAAAFVKDDGKLADSVNSALELAARKLAEEGEDDKITINRNVETHQGIVFHTVNVETPVDEVDGAQAAMLTKVLGDEMVFVIGTGPDALYLGFGATAIDSIKLAASSQGGDSKGQAIHAEITFFNIMSFAQSINTDKNAAPIIDALVASLKETGNDKVLIDGKYEGNMASSRIEIQEGLIRLIGVGVQEFQKAAMGGRDLEEF